MLYDFEISINVCKNKSCSNDLNIYKTKNEANYKSNNSTSGLNSNQEEFKKSFMIFYIIIFYLYWRIYKIYLKPRKNK